MIFDLATNVGYSRVSSSVLQYELVAVYYTLISPCSPHSPHTVFVLSPIRYNYVMIIKSISVSTYEWQYVYIF